MALLATLLFTVLLSVAHGTSGKKWWVLLEQPQVFKCQGSADDFAVDKNDVMINNTKGVQRHYLEGPGTYVIVVNNVKVKEPVKNLMGQIKISLAVPVVQFGKIASWDYNYEADPERQLTGGYKCGKGSGVVQDGGKSYCRYCDVCTMSDKADEKLNNGKVDYLPNEGSPDEPKFSQTCRNVEGKTYTHVQRTVQLPDEDTMNQQVNSQFTGVQGQLKQKLNKGRGKLTVELQLLSCDKPAATEDQVYQQSQACKCCSSNAPWTCKMFGAFGCNQANCGSEYAQKCGQGNCKKVACATVQFSYQVTDNPAEVKAYLQKNGYKDELHDFDGGQNKLK